MDDVQKARQLDGDDLQLDPPIVDSDEHEPVVKSIGGCGHDSRIAGVLQSRQGVRLADPVPAGRLGKPDLPHIPLRTTQSCGSILWPKSLSQNLACEMEVGAPSAISVMHRPSVTAEARGAIPERVARDSTLRTGTPGPFRRDGAQRDAVESG